MALPIDTVTKRRHRRHSVALECIVVDEVSTGSLATRTIDLSYDGALVAAEWPLPVGSLLRMRMRMPDTRVWFNARGVVRRVSRGRRDGDAGPSMGVYIYEMNGMDRVMLSTITRAYPTPPCPRGDVRDYAREVRRIARP